MGRSVNAAGRRAIIESQQDLLDKQPQPEPEKAAAVHKEREDRLFEETGTGTGEPAHIDRITRGRFVERVFHVLSEKGLPGGDGEFVDLGSGTATANVVSFLSLIWPHYFTAVNAVDIAQDVGTMHEVMDMRRRVAGVHGNVSSGMMSEKTKNTANIAWWTVADELSPGMVFQPYRGVASNCWYTSVLFARASMIYSCDLKFADAAVLAYRREIVQSLVHNRQLVYVTCKEVGGREMRTAEDGEWVSFLGKGTNDIHIGPYVRSVCKLKAKGNVDVAWEDTDFYIVILRGPNEALSLEIAKTVMDDDAPTIEAIRQATNRAIKEAYEEVDVQTSDLDAFAGKGVTSAASLQYAELTEDTMSTVISFLHEEHSHLGITAQSKILDVGSGFGKGVLNFALAAPLCRSVTGVEIVQHRHAASVNVVETLRQRSTSWKMRLEKIFLMHGDAASPGFDYTPYTHIFMFDVYFDEDTHRRIFSRMCTRPEFSVLISFHDEKTLEARGWPMKQVPLISVGHTEVICTDKKEHSFFVYEREE